MSLDELRDKAIEKVADALERAPVDEWLRKGADSAEKRIAEAAPVLSPAIAPAAEVLRAHAGELADFTKGEFVDLLAHVAAGEDYVVPATHAERLAARDAATDELIEDTAARRARREKAAAALKEALQGVAKVGVQILSGWLVAQLHG